MTRKGGTSQACASCKYQRRRCTVDCPLAPYFPADQPNMFQNAHRLFGVSNIIKILKQIDPSQRGVAMKSIIEQANARAKYPVYGCVAEIQQLWIKVQLAEEELHAVQAQLAFYRQHNQQQEISSTGPTPTDSALPLQLGTMPPPLPISPAIASNGFTLFHQDAPPQYCNAAALTAFPVSHPSYSNGSNAAYNNNNNSSTAYVDSKENNNMNSLWIPQQQHYGNSNSNNNNTGNPMMMQPQLGSSQPITIQQENIQDYDEIHPFFDSIDDRQSYIDSKEAYESSSESSLKDIAQSVEQNELKNAAARFSLTSVNL